MILNDNHSLNKAILTAVETNPTPFYLYRESALLEQCRRVLAMPSAYGHRVRYAIKAASNRNILKIFQNQGLHFDASSEWEVSRMLEVGIKGTRVMLTAQQLATRAEAFLVAGVQLNACSLHQLSVYGKLCARYDKPISIRVNPGETYGIPFKVNVSGKNSSFGIWHEQLPQAIALAKKVGVRIETLHSHVGSGTAIKPWLDAACTCIKMLKHLKEVRTLNLGGGFKVDRIGDQHTDLQAVGQAVVPLFKQHFKDTGNKLTLEIEPGTFMVASTADLVASVDDITSSGKDGYRFCKLNTGMNDYIRCSLYSATHRISHIKTTASTDSVIDTSDCPTVLVGHCCENGDILSPAKTDTETVPPMQSVSLKTPQIGDLVVFHATGAYGSSMASNYNSFPLIAELLQRLDGKVLCIRQMQSIKQIIANEKAIVD